MESLDLDNLAMDIEKNMHIYYNGIYLTERQIDILNSNGFDYKKYKNIKELIFDLDEYLNENSDNIDLEEVLEALTEFDYYHNVNK